MLEGRLFEGGSLADLPFAFPKSKIKSSVLGLCSFLWVLQLTKLSVDILVVFQAFKFIFAMRIIGTQYFGQL